MRLFWGILDKVLLHDERKGRESARVELRKKRGREDSDLNGIGL